MSTPGTPSVPNALWVVGVGELAGVGRHVLDVADVGIPGWDVRFLLPNGPLKDELASRNSVVELPFGPGVGLAHSIRSVGLAARRGGFRVVHSHLAWADLMAAAARVRPAIRVSTEHGIAGHSRIYARNRLDAAAMKWAHTARMRRTRGIICVSEATAQVVRDRWKPSSRTDVVVIRNGMDRVELAEGRPRSPVATVGYLGRFAPEKRVDLLVRAFSKLADSDSKVVLRLAGAGEGEQQLKALATSLGLGDRVLFDGWVDADRWLGKIDVLAIPSVWENCSYAILQTLAKGVPVVAAPVGGNPELLPATCLASPLDPEAFASALAAQLSDGTDPIRLPDIVPTRQQMCEQMASAYDAWVPQGATG